MRLRKMFLGAVIAGVGVGLLMTAPVAAQSVSLGNGVFNMWDADGDRIVDIGTLNRLEIGSTGADIDLLIRDTVAGAQALWFNTSVGALYIGGTDAGGIMGLRDTVGQLGLQATAVGDLTLGGGANDGDLIIREGTTGITNMLFDGDTATTTLGANGVAGDAGTLFFRDTNGTTNNIRMYGSNADVYLGTSSGDDGDISLYDGSAGYGFYVRGSSGQVWQKPTGQGLVKAWARINSDGTVASCYYCSASASNTGLIITGTYEVDFTFDSDITLRPVACSPGHNGTGSTIATQISCVGRGGDASSIFVVTRNSAGTAVNSYFTAVVF